MIDDSSNKTPSDAPDDAAPAELPNKLRLIRPARGLSLQDLADRMGTTNQQLSHLELGKRQLTQDWLRRLAEALDTTAANILGEPGWSLDRSSAKAWEPPVFTIDITDVQEPELAHTEIIEVLGERFVPIPVFAAVASAGPGNHVESDAIRHHILFREDWLRQVTLASFARIKALSVEGDSMEPTLRSGDTVLIDSLIEAPREDGIYVLRYDGLLQVKRLRTDPVRRLVTIISDNPAYPPVIDVSPGDVRLAGRVIWIGRRV